MTDVSPVTESEMKQFFDRIATTFVGLSAQAQELERLRSAMEELNRKLNDMATDNANLRKEISDTYELVSGVERERDEAKRQVQTAETQNNYLRDCNKEQLATIEALQADVRRLTDSIAVANRETQDAKIHADGLSRELDKAKQGRDYWRDRAEQAEKTANIYNEECSKVREAKEAVEAKLSSAMTKLGEAVSLLSPPAPEPAEPPIGSGLTAHTPNW